MMNNIVLKYSIFINDEDAVFILHKHTSAWKVYDFFQPFIIHSYTEDSSEHNKEYTRKLIIYLLSLVLYYDDFKLINILSNELLIAFWPQE